MCDKFGQKLEFWLKNEQIERKELIAKLQEERYHEFKGLDLITLSRWIRGKVVPSIYKQMIIAYILKVDLLHFVSNLRNIPNIPLRIDRACMKLKQGFTHPLHEFSYTKNADTVMMEVLEESIDEHFNCISSYYDNIGLMKDSIGRLPFDKESLRCETIFLKNENNEIIGHWSEFISKRVINSIFKELNVNHSIVDCDNALFVFSFHAMTYQDFLCLIKNSLLRRLKGKRSCDSIYIFVPGYLVYEFFCKVFDAEECLILHLKVDGHRKMGFIIKMELLKLISNPLIMSLLKG
ncbi:hypothetical protein [Vibrio sp. Sgm 5]|uniref:hypothetical protein n=1 Tax=Vibrio sp. Sgm 5 TaxID=2994387 RepID=UPI002248B1CB|nr:hypothetical protein [Vibrio sp. Sgm 5]MCX2792538.1 hypothetical protein [Vibrio sp. Sgm 5]